MEREITFSRLGPNGEQIPAREPGIKAIHVDGEYSEELAERVQGFLTPAPKDQIERWLAELSVITAKRADDDLSEELRLSAYTNRLMDYPADMVRQVLVVKRWKFFPTWFELAELLDKMNVERGRVVSALSRPWVTQKPEEYKPEPVSNVVRRDPQHVKDVLAQMEAKLRASGEWKEAAE